MKQLIKLIRLLGRRQLKREIRQLELQLMQEQPHLFIISK